MLDDLFESLALPFCVLRIVFEVRMSFMRRIGTDFDESLPLARAYAIGKTFADGLELTEEEVSELAKLRLLYPLRQMLQQHNGAFFEVSESVGFSLSLFAAPPPPGSEWCTEAFAALVLELLAADHWPLLYLPEDLSLENVPTRSSTLYRDTQGMVSFIVIDTDCICPVHLTLWRLRCRLAEPMGTSCASWPQSCRRDTYAPTKSLRCSLNTGTKATTCRLSWLGLPRYCRLRLSCLELHAWSRCLYALIAAFVFGRFSVTSSAAVNIRNVAVQSPT